MIIKVEAVLVVRAQRRVCRGARVRKVYEKMPARRRQVGARSRDRRVERGLSVPRRFCGHYRAQDRRQGVRLVPGTAVPRTPAVPTPRSAFAGKQVDRYRHLYLMRHL